MSDRDDLAVAIAHPMSTVANQRWLPENCTRCRDAGPAADRLIADGWHHTVALPEQVSIGQLKKCPAHPGHAPFLAAHACPWCTITKLQATGRPATQEQLDAAAQAIDSRISIPELPGLSMALARAVARAFGVSIDGAE
jgi:hypothetical protein